MDVPIILSTQCTHVKLCACVLWQHFSLRQGSSLERWRVQLWINFSKWGLSKGRRHNIKTWFKNVCRYTRHIWCLLQPLLLYLCCRITLYDYQALCKEYAGSSDSARTLSDVSGQDRTSAGRFKDRHRLWYPTVHLQWYDTIDSYLRVWGQHCLNTSGISVNCKADWK